MKFPLFGLVLVLLGWTHSIGRKVGIPRGILPHVQTGYWESRLAYLIQTIGNRVAKFLEVVDLIPPSKFEFFRESPSINSQNHFNIFSSNLYPQPQNSYPHPHLEF